MAVVGQRHATDRSAGNTGSVPLLRSTDRAGVWVDHRGVPRNALAHRWASADDVQGARLEPREQIVEIVVTGGQTGDGVAAFVRFLQLVHRQRHQIAQRLDGIGDPVFGNLEDFRLGLVECFGDIVGLVVGDLCDLGSNPDQAAQDRCVLDDLGVSRCVGNGRRRVLQFEQQFSATHLLEQPRAAQFIGNSHRIDRVACGVQTADRVVNVLMRRLVEIVDRQAHLGHRANGIARQQQSAEQ